MNKRGLLIVFSGPSGCGKGTVMKEFFSRRDDTGMSVSVTTRKPREGERHGVEYFFCSREEFEQMIKDDALLEYAEYSGNYYGTPLPPIEKWLSEGKNVILEIEVQGAQKVMSRHKEDVSIFITPPSMEILEERLRGRGTETEEVIQRRLDAAKWELSLADTYQYIVCNDEVKKAADEIEAILEAEKQKIM
jgi:guanylate kinase